MAFKDIFKISRKTFFYPTGWLGADAIKDNTETIINATRGLFTPAEPTRKETFEEALERQGLTVNEIDQIAYRYQMTGYFFLALGILDILFAFYLLFHYWTFSGWLLGVASTALLLAQAFKYDFWHFQIRQRKLGCTISEWWNGVVQNKGDAP